MTDEQNIEPQESKVEGQTPHDDLQAKCDEYLAGWKRALADYENLKKDIARTNREEKARLIRRLSDGIISNVVNLELATKHKPDFSDLTEESRKKLDQWVQGILYIQKGFEALLNEYGVVAYEPKIGEPFDEKRQEAVGLRKEEGFISGVIVEVINVGWKLEDVVIKPARVLVSE